ncbi:MAG TPA: VWA domain-containing protein [Bdellovibrionales bacterium]|nr:VWA domain-containing protein [Bdellovibrionales bacterium]
MLGLVRRAVAVAAIGSLCLGCSEQKFGLAPADQNFGQKVEYNKNVDMLFVVDTSGSMKKHQDLLADQIDLLVKSFKDTGLSFQFAVTTMDMGSGGQKGKFLFKPGTSPVLTSNTSNLSKILEDRLRVGDNATSSLERGLEAMKAALSAPLATTGLNSGFMRSPSLLVVVFLTNEEDVSASADYATFLDSIHPPFETGDRSWVAQFMGVMPNDPACQTSDWGFSSVGYKYIELADASGGASESICDADLRRALTNVKGRILEIMTEYKLDRVPNPATIKIYVEGKRIPEDAVNGWTYDADRVSIKFHGNAVPAPGSRISVKYDPVGPKE